MHTEINEPKCLANWEDNHIEKRINSSNFWTGYHDYIPLVGQV